jgi:hypothetical protein
MLLLQLNPISNYWSVDCWQSTRSNSTFYLLARQNAHLRPQAREQTTLQLGLDVPAPRIGRYVLGDLLDLQESVEAVLSEVAANTALLESTPTKQSTIRQHAQVIQHQQSSHQQSSRIPWGLAEGGLGTVDPNDTGADLSSNALASRLVTAGTTSKCGERTCEPGSE